MSHIKDVAFSITAILFAAAFAILCFTIIINPNAGADDKKWATSFVTLVVGGFVGYATGKAAS